MRLINKRGAKRTSNAQIKKNQQTEVNMKKAEKIATATRIVREEIEPWELEITGSGTPMHPLHITTNGKAWGDGWDALVICEKGKITDVDGSGRYQDIDRHVSWVEDVAKKLIKAKIRNFTLSVTKD